MDYIDIQSGNQEESVPGPDPSGYTHRRFGPAREKREFARMIGLIAVARVPPERRFVF